MAEAYPYREPLIAQCFPLQSAILRFMSNYNAVVKICADEQGLYFSVMFLFRPGHRALFCALGRNQRDQKAVLSLPSRRSAFPAHA
jgi:hypothetical protein